MARGIGLEDLREVFKDKRTHIAVAKIEQLSLVEDRSVLKCRVLVYPELREVICRMSWEVVGHESGLFSFPEVDDLVLVAFADGDDDTAHVIKRLTSKEEKIPVTAIDGSFVMKSRQSKNLILTANEAKLLLSQGDTAPTENLVLGQQLKALLSNILSQLKSLSEEIKTHTHIGNLGYPTDAPIDSLAFQQFSDEFDNLKESPVEDEGILSKFAFTEKGS